MEVIDDIDRLWRSLGANKGHCEVATRRVRTLGDKLIPGLPDDRRGEWEATVRPMPEEVGEAESAFGATAPDALASLRTKVGQKVSAAIVAMQAAMKHANEGSEAS